MDTWGVGRYETTAAEIAPASDVAVAALGLTGGERVLDVACGTGNAALVAQRAGADVTGLDGSPRLLEVARERIPGGAFVLGDCGQLPFEDGHFDAAVSVFGVIFAHPAKQAGAEMARVVAAGGRVAITTWPPRGPMYAAVSLLRAAGRRARPEDSAEPFDWGDPAVVEALLAPFGDVEVAEHELTHERRTAEEFWDRWEKMHPMWIGARERLEPTGVWPELRRDGIAALREGGIEDGATSPYLLAVLDRR